MQAKLWSMNGLSVELAMDRRSLARRLEDLSPDKVTKQGKQWKLARVHRHLAGIEANTAQQEKARLDRLRADQVELQLQRDRGELIPISEIEPALSSLVIAARNELLTIPDRYRNDLLTLHGVDADPTILRDYIEQSLTTLSRYEYGGNTSTDEKLEHE